MRILGLILPLLLAASGPAFARAVVPIDADWLFIKADVSGAEAPDAPTRDWQAVALPHTWNAVDGQNAGAYYRGVGWYRRHLRFAEVGPGQRAFLRFGAASMAADVYLNGAHVGHHDGGFTAFVFDVTDQALAGRDNVLAVRVSNARDRRIAPLDADFTFFGGLYRGAQLIVTDPLHVSVQDYASSGVYAQTVSVSAQTADLGVTVMLANDGAAPAGGTLRLTLVDQAGTTVSEASAAVTVAAGARPSQTLHLAVPAPHLWNGRADPYLYHLKTEIGGDAVSVPFGIREIAVDPDAGLRLNGVPLALRGVAMHQDWKGKGWALSQADHAASVALLLEVGANAVRLCHYPHAPEELDLFDENGVLAWSEIPLVNTIDPDPAFADVTRQQLIEMIHQLYNHPSIAFWGLFNEVKADPTGLVASLNALAHREDPTRPTAGATDRPLAFPLHAIPDVLAFNKYDGWYYRALADFGPEMDAAHAAFPTKPVGVSEYGAGANAQQHTDTPGTDSSPHDFHPEERQSAFHESYLAQLGGRPYIFGHFVWNLFDFAAANRNEGGQPGLNDKGLVTYDRALRKDAFFLYEATWTQTPVVHITSRRFTKRQVASTGVKIYANQPELAVTLNGAALGPPDRRDGVVWEWRNVQLAPGVNRVVARTAAGVQDEVTWTLFRPASPLRAGLRSH